MSVVEKAPYRLPELAHYVIAQVPPRQLGATKLNKLLWFIDCSGYNELGYTISGLNQYARREFGPAPFKMPVVIRALEKSGAISKSESGTAIGYLRSEYSSVLDPKSECFTDSERAIIHRVINEHLTVSAREVSDISHDALWEQTEMDKPMPVRLGAVQPRKISQRGLEWAHSEVARLGL